MPSGYTSDIYDGTNTDPRDYVLRAARGLGFLMHMRDDKHDAPIRKREVSDYYEKGLAEAYAELEFAETASDDALGKRQGDEVAASHTSAERSERIQNERKARYDEVMDRLVDWAPRTESGQRVREYAIEHLQESINFDTGYDVWRYVQKPMPLDEYRTHLIENAQRKVTMRFDDVERERKNKEETDRWIDGLMEDLERL